MKRDGECQKSIITLIPLGCLEIYVKLVDSIDTVKKSPEENIKLTTKKQIIHFERNILVEEFWNNL